MADDFVSYLNAAVTGFHCVAECKRRLADAGFAELDEKSLWSLEPGGQYYYVRNDSALVAFAVGVLYDAKTSGAIIVGAHTDSPCPKLKPSSTLEKEGCVMLGVVGYGGGLWHTWFDRDLSVAGRVLVTGASGYVEARLVYINKPLCRISNLAIHLNTPDERSGGFKPNLQQHLPPMLATNVAEELWKTDADGGGSAGRHHPLLLLLLAKELGVEAAKILDFELQLVDTQPACVGGAADEFVFSGRLDNQACCYLGVQALIESRASLAETSAVRIVALFDHEEVGSCSATGAEGPLLRDALLRIPASLPSPALDVAGAAFRARSLLISADMAHAHHPNYGDRHDPKHLPKLRRGLVVKHNANQRYATDAIGATFMRLAASKGGVAPCQEFAVRADCACGSTIGPISAAGLGVRTVDVGAPMLSMHSIRELCAVDDVAHSKAVFKAAFDHFSTLAQELLGAHC
ncbi:aspartyl aminopeptidase [Pelagophyceae sp. CCMP2097]|nr:aspartyl aminopeptidase [Pelagophyceae sp. CCMP2097]|mmetsp:Transcript_9079/g.29988  ORF Transcript_9079/g.29988 Transcript_9079/m.29988 type:complete len:462 (+) Transcript_9079:40-1425(+)